MERLGCKKIKDNLLADLKERTQKFVNKGNKAPSLAVVLVGDDGASQSYVATKCKMASLLGFVHFDYRFSEDFKEDELLELIDRLNLDDDVDGILVQLPLPKHIDADKIINRIAKEKDVDGFSPYNLGRLMLGQECFEPCTPKGIMEIFRYYDIPLSGKNVTVIGRSNIVGKPVSMMCMQKGVDATVTVCNTKTADLRAHTLASDVIIVAAGRPGTLDSSMVKDGAVVIDVGVNRIADPSSDKGYKVVGDVDYDSFSDTGCKVTPVPGGVGLMTVVMLMENTLMAAIRRRG